MKKQDLTQFKKYEETYHRNLQILQKQSSYLIPFVSKPFSTENLTVIETKDNVPTLSYESRLIHSRRHPLKEAEKFVLSNNVQEDDFIVLYGFGLGYHVKEIVKNLSDDGFLYVVECNHDLLRAAFTLLDLKDVLESPNVFIITGGSDMEVAQQLDSQVFWAFENVEEERKKILFFNPSLENIPRKFSRINDVFDLFSFQKRARYSLGDRMAENLKLNIPEIIRSSKASSLFGTCGDVPAFLLGAGPGLDNAISIIKSYRDKALIFAVDSACLSLYAAGIEPDFVFSVDPKEETAQNYTGIPHVKNLVVTPSVLPAVFQVPHDHVITIVQEKSLAREICGELLDSFGLTRAGGSVSCIMFDVAAQMGVKRVLFAGMDYGFPGWKFYAVRTPEHKKLIGEVSRFRPVETISIDVIRSQKVVYMNNASGMPVPTYQSLYSYARSMEQLIKEYDDLPVYNLFSDGVFLQGTRNVFFEEELDELISEAIDREKIFAQVKPADLKEEEKEALAEITRKDLSNMIF